MDDAGLRVTVVVPGGTAGEVDLVLVTGDVRLSTLQEEGTGVLVLPTIEAKNKNTLRDNRVASCLHSLR